MKAAVGRIKALTKQLPSTARGAWPPEQAAGELAREQTVLDNLHQRLEAPKAAQTEMAELAPVAARADAVTALERELDQRRRNHDLIPEVPGAARAGPPRRGDRQGAR